MNKELKDQTMPATTLIQGVGWPHDNSIGDSEKQPASKIRLPKPVKDPNLKEFKIDISYTLNGKAKRHHLQLVHKLDLRETDHMTFSPLMSAARGALSKAHGWALEECNDVHIVWVDVTDKPPARRKAVK